VIVVLSPEAEEPSLPPGVAATFVRDALPDEGPLSGALAGLEACRSSWALLVAGDMPDLRTAVLLEMVRVASQATATDPVDAVVLQDGDRFRPVPALLRRDPALAAAHTLFHGAERRLRALPQALRTAVIDEATWHALDPDRSTLHDVDEPGDLVEG
jgi:molybdopterin-guanine dinucleotide biosynthesis protein A